MMETNPKTPVVAKEEDRKLEPDTKRAFQKAVLLILAGLNFNQSYKKVFGPVPKTTPFFKDCFDISIVVCHDGLTSENDIPSAPVSLPAEPLNKTKNKTTTMAKIDGLKIFLKTVASARCSLLRVIIKTNKEKNPKIIQFA